MSYATFAKYYDDAMGDMSEKITFLKSLISTHAPNAASVLEFASGTGTILEGLSSDYAVAGIELSPEMLTIANKKLPKVDMRLGDMTSHSMDKQYDVTLCVYDSINHLMKWESWTALFDNAYKHLNAGGIFIFDINTIERLQWLASQSHEFQPAEDTLSIKISEQDGIFSWNIAIPAVANGRHTIETDMIQEISFPVEEILAELSPQFTVVDILDPKGRSKEDPNWRPFFVCRKK
jgi:SAM-dependent methyltransferase